MFVIYGGEKLVGSVCIDYYFDSLLRFLFLFVLLFVLNNTRSLGHFPSLSSLVSMGCVLGEVSFRGNFTTPKAPCS